MTTPLLTDRIRGLLPQDAALREVRMFGGVGFMVDEALTAHASGGGDLLVRVDPARHDELLRRPGARRATMGVDRDMGPSWLRVAADALDDAALAEWIDVALSRPRAD